MPQETLFHINQLLNSLPGGRTEAPPETNFELMNRLMVACGNPHLAFRNVIHVAGTSGKGSTCMFLERFLVSQGYTVNVYTSPHIHAPTERIRLQGTDIEAQVMYDYLLDLQEYFPHIQFNFFHALTACAFLAFQDNPADFTILETGMGGRCDATNVIEPPLATLFTPISKDHQAFLGSELTRIAREKAGIGKARTPFISTHQDPAVLTVLEETADSLKSPLLKEGTLWDVDIQEDSFRFRYDQEHFEFDLPSLMGDHQVQNASLALACLFYLDLAWDKEALNKALRKVRWPGRLEKVLFQGKELWLDGAHNAASAQALSNFFGKKYKGKKFNVIFSMTKSEDVYAFLQALQPHVAKLYCPYLPPPFIEQSIVERSCWNLKIPYQEFDTVEECLRLCVEKPENLMTTGSLYLVGEMVSLLGNKEEGGPLRGIGRAHHGPHRLTP